MHPLKQMNQSKCDVITIALEYTATSCELRLDNGE